MKKLIFVVAVLFAGPALARDVYVQPHYNSNGTYVQGYERTAPDSTRLNNYSTQGNVNPYTGQAGTVNPYTPPQQVAPSYGGYAPQQNCYTNAYGNRSCN